MAGLREVFLQNNGLDTVELGAFDDLVSVAEMDLRFNPISNIANNAFATMTSLQRLLLGSEFISCESVNVASPPCDDGSIFLEQNAAM